VLEVEDLVAEAAAVRSAGCPIDEGLTPEPWGLQDFRLFDPDGYDIRFTNPALEPSLSGSGPPSVRLRDYDRSGSRRVLK
jgi:hypothetical protein